MNIVLLGIGIGFLTLLPPGPVSLTLVQVGARLGHRPALRGAFGIAGGDSVLALVAVGIVGLGAALPQSVFSTAQVVAAALLILIGAALLVKPDVAASSIDRIQRPGRTLFLLTSFTPTALGAWIALLAAMPFAADTARLGLFAVGVVIASCLWHPALGALASTLGARLSDRGQERLAQSGGVTMGVLGIALAARQLL
jgi:threonine/homoserine/homoserine lactone efflux protein